MEYKYISTNESVITAAQMIEILSKFDKDTPMFIVDDTAKKLFAKDLLASDLYRQVFCHKYNQTLPNEYQHSPIVL